MSGKALTVNLEGEQFGDNRENNRWRTIVGGNRAVAFEITTVFDFIGKKNDSVRVRKTKTASVRALRPHLFRRGDSAQQFFGQPLS